MVNIAIKGDKSFKVIVGLVEITALAGSVYGGGEGWDM